VFNDPFPVQHIWSLNVEAHCYLLLALVATSALLRRKAAVVLISLGLLTFAAVGLHHLLQGHARVYLYDTECAATGLLLSAGYRVLRRPWRVPSWAPIAALLIAPWFHLPTTPGAASLQLAAQIAIPPMALAFAVNGTVSVP
jgi:peptidoglycan/LPS O-acetylase OafA/YrhL